MKQDYGDELSEYFFSISFGLILAVGSFIWLIMTYSYQLETIDLIKVIGTIFGLQIIFTSIIFMKIESMEKVMQSKKD